MGSKTKKGGKAGRLSGQGRKLASDENEGVYLKLFRKKKESPDKVIRQQIKEMGRGIMRSIEEKPVAMQPINKKEVEEKLPKEVDKEIETKEEREVKKEVKPVLQELEVESTKYDTDIDVLYNLIKKKGAVKLSLLAKYFGVDRNKIEEWATILQEHSLAEMYYPIIGEPELMKFGLKKEERKKLLTQKVIEKKEQKKEVVKEEIEKKEPEKEIAKKEIEKEIAKKEIEKENAKKEIEKVVELKKFEFFKKVWLIIKNPKIFFSLIRSEQSIKRALLFYFLLIIFIFILQMIIKIVKTFLENPLLGLFVILGSLVGVFLWLLIVLALFIPMVFLMSGLYHILVKIFGGKNPFNATFKAVIYASVPGMIISIFNGVPYIEKYAFVLNLVAFLWVTLVLTIGIAVLQNMNYIKAFVVAIIPTLIIIGLIILLSYVYYGDFFKFFGYTKESVSWLNTLFGKG